MNQNYNCSMGFYVANRQPYDTSVILPEFFNCMRKYDHFKYVSDFMPDINDHIDKIPVTTINDTPTSTRNMYPKPTGAMNLNYADKTSSSKPPKQTEYMTKKYRCTMGFYVRDRKPDTNVMMPQHFDCEEIVNETSYNEPYINEPFINEPYINEQFYHESPIDKILYAIKYLLNAFTRKHDGTTMTSTNDIDNAKTTNMNNGNNIAITNSTLSFYN